MTIAIRSQQILDYLLNSPEGDVYSVEVEHLQKVIGIPQFELEGLVKHLVYTGYPITSIHCELYGFKRFQMNQNYKLQSRKVTQ